MLILIFICVGALLLNLLIQLGAIASGVQCAIKFRNGNANGLLEEIRVLGIIVTVLFFGHLLQILVWALLFWGFGQIENFSTSFYHSTVNYTTLGYGDIVMEEPWRLAGAIEASVGVMMFGVSTATLFSALTQMFRGRFGGKQKQHSLSQEPDE